MSDPCESCGRPMRVRCPCGECGTVTDVRHCPECEPERLARSLRMDGVQVCEAYVESRLGRPL